MGVVSQIADQLETDLTVGHVMTENDVALVAVAAKLMRGVQEQMDALELKRMRTDEQPTQ